MGSFISSGSQQLLEFSSEGARALVDFDHNHFQPHVLYLHNPK